MEKGEPFVRALRGAFRSREKDYGFVLEFRAAQVSAELTNDLERL
jgi:hypothetical protein